MPCRTYVAWSFSGWFVRDAEVAEFKSPHPTTKPQVTALTGG